VCALACCRLKKEGTLNVMKSERIVGWCTLRDLLGFYRVGGKGRGPPLGTSLG
jgi:hypothetical protein